MSLLRCIFGQHRRGILAESVAVELSALAVHLYEPLYAGFRRLRIKKDFLSHIQECYGVKRLLANPADEITTSGFLPKRNRDLAVSVHFEFRQKGYQYCDSSGAGAIWLQNVIWACFLK